MRFAPPTRRWAKRPPRAMLGVVLVACAALASCERAADDALRFGLSASTVTLDPRSAPPAGANRGRYADPTVDRLIERAEAAEDLKEQAALYRELQRLLLDALPNVPLGYEDHVFVTRAGIEGYRVAADGNYDGLVDVTRQRAGRE